MTPWQSGARRPPHRGSAGAHRGAARVQVPVPVRAAGLFALALALSACGTSTPMRYFSLQAMPAGTTPSSGPMAAAPCDGPPIAVRSVAVPPELDRAELTRDLAPGQFEVREFDHWAAPLAPMARQVLAEDLAARLPAGCVVMPGGAGPAPGAQLSVEIQHVDIHAGEAAMVLSWAVRWQAAPGATAEAPQPAPPRPPIGGTLRLRQPAGTEASQVAAAWNALLAEASGRIALGLRPLSSAETAPATPPCLPCAPRPAASGSAPAP